MWVKLSNRAVTFCTVRSRYRGKVLTSESFAVEGKQTYLWLNFRDGQKYRGARSKCLAVHIKNTRLSISGVAT